MAKGRETFLRRQKEIARQKRQQEKRQAKAIRKAQGTAGKSGDDELAEIQAAVDAGLNPGSAKDRQ
jgi:hypothetical protein